MLANSFSPRSSRRFERRVLLTIMLEAKDGQSEAVADILRAFAAPTRAEPGVKIFLCYRSPTNKSLFFLFELFVDKAGWEAHEATDHFKVAVKDVLPLVTRRERVPFIPFLTTS